MTDATIPRFELRQGDALQLLAELEPESVHAVVTDPPYCSGGFSETGKRQSKGMTEAASTGAGEWFHGDNMGTAGLVHLLRGVAVEAGRVLVPGGSLLVFCDWRMVSHLGPALESVGLRWQNLVVWDKGSAGMGWGFKARHELVLHLVKGVGCYYSKKGTNVLRARRVTPGEKIHPTEKPVGLIEQLIEVVAPPDGLVVDPFAGSGSCGEAALRTGRRWIGFDVSGDFVARATHRLAGVPLPQDLSLFPELAEADAEELP